MILDVTVLTDTLVSVLRGPGIPGPLFFLLARLGELLSVVVQLGDCQFERDFLSRSFVFELVDEFLDDGLVHLFLLSVGVFYSNIPRGLCLVVYVFRFARVR